MSAPLYVAVVFDGHGLPESTHGADNLLDAENIGNEALASAHEVWFCHGKPTQTPPYMACYELMNPFDEELDTY